jgi:hypothetical protein
MHRGSVKNWNGKTYPIQNNIHITSRVNNRRFAKQLHDCTQHADDAVLDVLEVGGQDAGGLRVVHGELVWDVEALRFAMYAVWWYGGMVVSVGVW